MKSHQILCPIDYSASSEPAIQIATDLAQVHKSKIILLHVIDGGKPISVEDLQMNNIADRIRDRDLLDKDVEYQHVSLRGNPSDVIVEYAHKHAIDLIVIGTHGRSGLAGVLTGSVAKTVMAQAGCMVVAVKIPRSS